MQLRRIALRDFRRFASFEASFDPGFNVIVGNNEEGKSTLREAITAALFYKPTSTAANVTALTRWGADQRFAVDLEFSAGDETFRLSKDFQARSAKLQELGAGRTLTDAKAIEARLADLLGVRSLPTYDSTVRITQRDITQLQDRPTIADSLQALVTGGEDNVGAAQVLEEIDKQLKSLRSAGRGSPGPLWELPQTIEAKERELARQRERLAAAEKAAARLSEKQDELKATQRALAKKEQLESNARQRLALAEGLAKADATEQSLAARLDQVRQLTEQISADAEALAPYRPLLALTPEQLSEIGALERQASLADASAGAPSPVPTAAGPRVALIALGVLLALAGLAGGLLWQPLFALALVGAGLLVWELARGRSAAAEAAAMAAQLHAREQKEKSEQAAARLREVLSTLNCSSAAAFYERRRQAELLARRLSQAEGRLEGMLGGETPATIEARRRDASAEVRRLRDGLDEPALRLAQMDELAYVRLVNEVEGLRGHVETLQEEIRELAVAVRVNQVDLDEMHSLAEEAQELQRRLDAAREREKVLLLVKQVLAEARAASLVTAKDALEAEVGRLIAEITRGRYDRVEVDPNTLEVRVLSPEAGRCIPVKLDGELSTGTVEQVYLAARLALAKLLTQDRQPPLILDDPFVTFDGPRTAAVLSLCRRLAAEQQILLFTCREAYTAVADKVIRLPSLAGAPLPAAVAGDLLPTPGWRVEAGAE